MEEKYCHFTDLPKADYLIAGWRRQWSDGGDISSGLSRYLINKTGAKKIGQMSTEVGNICFPFHIAGTHDIFRPRVSFKDGLPSSPPTWENAFYDAGDGLIIFRGNEPWYDIERYGAAFFDAINQLGVKQTINIEGYNGPAPPELERRVSCVYSDASMRGKLDQYGFQYSNYGSTGRQGPTIGMALVNMAHYKYPQNEVLRIGAMAPMYPFTTQKNRQVGINTDHRAYYDIMRRLRDMYDLSLDLTELRDLGIKESAALQKTLDRISENNQEAKDIIAKAAAEYEYKGYVDQMSDTLPPVTEDLS